MVGSSLTRFGEISPLRLSFKSIRESVRVYFLLGEILNLICQSFLCHWANFHWSKWPNVEQLIQHSGHTGWEVGR